MNGLSTRRLFLRRLGLISGALMLPGLARADSKPALLRFGVIADVHQDLQPNAAVRLQAFLDEAVRQRVDFIVELGDLSHSKGLGKILDVWNGYPGKRYHVIGNHDIDRMARPDLLKAMGMESGYYSFDAGPYHFIVLDSNYHVKDGKIDASRRDCMVDPAQLEWLKRDLAATGKPSIVFSHAGFDTPWGRHSCTNDDEVRRILQDAGEGRVIACFAGHEHIDLHAQIEGIHYFQINSASYYWVDGSNAFSNGHMAEYRDPLYAIVTLDPAACTIAVQGRKSEYLPPAPTAENCPRLAEMAPLIANRTVSYR